MSYWYEGILLYIASVLVHSYGVDPGKHVYYLSRVTRKHVLRDLPASKKIALAAVSGFKILSKKRKTMMLIRPHGIAGWSASLLFSYYVYGVRHVFSWLGLFLFSLFIS